MTHRAAVTTVLADLAHTRVWQEDLYRDVHQHPELSQAWPDPARELVVAIDRVGVRPELPLGERAHGLSELLERDAIGHRVHATPRDASRAAANGASASTRSKVLSRCAP